MENKKERKVRNERLFTTGGIFDMINPDILIHKNTKQKPYTLDNNIHYRRLVGLAFTFDKLLKEDNQEKLQQLENLGKNFLNSQSKENE